MRNVYNGAHNRRVEFMREVALEMVRLDGLIDLAVRDRDWQMAGHLQNTREDIMFARMEVLRRDWRVQRGL